MENMENLKNMKKPPSGSRIHENNKETGKEPIKLFRPKEWILINSVLVGEPSTLSTSLSLSSQLSVFSHAAIVEHHV